MGWVSILDPRRSPRALDVPQDWELIAYLCLGWPAEEHLDPSWSVMGWQDRTARRPAQVLKR